MRVRGDFLCCARSGSTDHLNNIGWRANFGSKSQNALNPNSLSKLAYFTVMKSLWKNSRMQDPRCKREYLDSVQNFNFGALPWPA